MLAETSAASDLCTRKGNPNFGDVHDVSAALERADLGGSLQPKELLRIAAVLRCARTVKSYIAEDEKKTVIAPLFQALSPKKYLEDRIYGAILSEEEIADNASPELSDIRRHMRIQAGKIRDSLQKVISSPAYAKFLRDPIITIRQGRYVVPVKSECKNEVPGLVHDVSATGSTYFVEPMSAVNANNALRELEIKEKKEIERILAELSSEAASHRDDINLNFTMLVRLDVIFAKAKLAYRMRAWEPLMNDEGRVELRNARDPLIDPTKVVPISLRLGTDFDTMIITGPNTGGKTVTLKTVGLLTLMAECGLHVPAGDGSQQGLGHGSVALGLHAVIADGSRIGRHDVGGHGLNAVADDPVQRAAEGIRRVAVQAKHEGRIDHQPPLVDIVHRPLGTVKAVLPLVNNLKRFLIH